MNRRLFLFALFTALSAVAVHGQTATITITPTTAWAPAISFTGLPGEDFAATFESAANEYRIAVANAGPPGVVLWRVEVRRQDLLWDAGLLLEIQRTGPGTAGPGGQITAGDLNVYQSVGTINATLIEGRRGMTDIPFQLRVSGAFGGAGVPAGVYTTTIIYTISDR